MLFRRRRIPIPKRSLPSLKYCVFTQLLVILAFVALQVWIRQLYMKNNYEYQFEKDSFEKLNFYDLQSNNTFAKLLYWNRTLCSEAADRRGPNQKVINLSVYGISSNFSNSPAFSWNTSILPFLEPLAHEVKLLLPSWTIRLYVDFTGSTKLQRDTLYKYSNVDVCDMENLPFFGSLLLTFLPGKMWRFLPVFDPYVDYTLSRDLDSPMLERETVTLNMWTSDAEKDSFFYMARDHFQHGMFIMGGLWGAANVRARNYLSEVFSPMLIPLIGGQYKGEGDQQFLSDYVWTKVNNHSLTFDSFHCAKFGGRPFPTQRKQSNFHLGCKRTCCHATKDGVDCEIVSKCPEACRPTDHKDWEYC